MRHSIETRVPFFDYRLVEAAVSLPVEYKARDGWTKYVLRAAVSDVLPHDVAWRKDKLGFEAPQRVWLTAYAETMKDEIRRSRILGEIADRDSIVGELETLSLKEQWAYFNLAVWERVYGVEWS